MREVTAYNIFKVGTPPEQAVAISKILAIENDTPEAKVIEGMKKAGLRLDAAEGLMKVFLDFAK